MLSVYKVRVELVTGSEGSRRETCYTATSEIDAVKSAARFAARMLANERLAEDCVADVLVSHAPSTIEIGALVVHTVTFGPIDEHGSPTTRNSFGNVLEWKCDRGLTLDQQISEFVQKARKQKRGA